MQTSTSRQRVGHVVVVEDDDVIGPALVDALQAGGFTASLVTRGRDVAGAMNGPGVDLVLLDVGLPDADGFTICRELRAQRPELAIVLVTARDTDIDIVVGLDAGAND